MQKHQPLTRGACPSVTLYDDFGFQQILHQLLIIANIATTIMNHYLSAPRATASVAHPES